MKTARVAILLFVTTVIATLSSVIAAPIESVESSRASVALQKVDAFLGEKAVADQLAALGLTREQASARLAQLSEAQIEELAAQVDLIKAGGTIQGTDTGRCSPIACFFKQLGALLHNIICAAFCWEDWK
jgi:hypothetical protein